MKFSVKSTLLQLVILLSVALFFQACGDDPTSTTKTDYSTVPEPYDISQADTSYTKEGGVKIYIIERGVGPFEVIPRDQISLYYTGRVYTENPTIDDIFESTYANGRETPAIITNLRTVSNGQQSPQIEGFRRGLLGMKVEEKRVIIVPPDLGYSNSRPGVGGMDLRDDTLRYDVKLAGIQ